MIILLMGVSGSGKTAVGSELASRHGMRFIDGDDLHPTVNVRKMAAGVPLTDEDRMPWLLAIRRALTAHDDAGSSAVIACSALKEGYRRMLLNDFPEVKLVYLRGSRATLERRLTRRKGHFFDPRLLQSQLAALEEPTDAATVDIDADLESVIEKIEKALSLSTEGIGEKA